MLNIHSKLDSKGPVLILEYKEVPSSSQSAADAIRGKLHTAFSNNTRLQGHVDSLTKLNQQMLEHCSVTKKQIEALQGGLADICGMIKDLKQQSSELRSFVQNMKSTGQHLLRTLLIVPLLTSISNGKARD